MWYTFMSIVYILLQNNARVHAIASCSSNINGMPFFWRWGVGGWGGRRGSIEEQLLVDMQSQNFLLYSLQCPSKLYLSTWKCATVTKHSWQMLTQYKISFLLDTFIYSSYCTCAWWECTFFKITWGWANHAVVMFRSTICNTIGTLAW